MPFALQARYVFPGDGPPLRDGIITLDGDRIVTVGEKGSLCPPHDLGNVAILPALVNAHTHLEFSHLAAPLGVAEMPFPNWIREVVNERRARTSSIAQTVGSSVRQGLEESIRSGTAALGEIATPDSDFASIIDSPMRGVVFLEMLGQSPARQHELERLAEGHADHPCFASGQWQAGLSPHAPYTVDIQFLRRIVELSVRRQLPLAMHLAESWSELELLSSGSGPLVSLLQEFEAWNPASVPRGIRALDYLEILRDAPRVLVVHGNYLAADEIEYLGGQPHMSVVYCPRTHARFGHAAYPLQELLKGGVNVCLGTDSRASNPDLSVWEEMRFLAARQAASGSDILRMGTLSGAVALGIDAHFGSLAPGKQARMVMARLDDDSSSDPYELLWRSQPEPCFFPQYSD